MKKKFNKIFFDKNIDYIEVRHSNSNVHYKKHVHETFSIGININGKSLYTNKNKSFTFEKNKLAIINPLTVHSCNSLEPIHNEYYMIYLNTNWCYKLQHSLNKNIQVFKPFSKDILNDEILYNQYLDLVKKLFSDDFYLDKENSIVNFFTRLFLKDIKTSFNKTHIKEDDILPILNYFDKNYYENISLKELEDIFNLNTFYII